ncbi:MAG TPA: hypothetical protein VEW03_01370, partial [Longimicrobiaceae bacterium]|nr:hypothetical protein [Longimicrobiaceae bacterium]
MTPRNSSPAADAAGPDVQELIRQRELLAGWIAKLDEVKTDAPGRVAERVRADYDARLRQVTADLLAHREEIERDLESRRGDQAAAEERLAHAADALQETQLRHLIGELDQGAWDEARPRLEGEVGAAEQALQQAGGEVERLSTLAAEIAAAAEPEPARQEPEAEEEAPAADAEAAAPDGGAVAESAGPEPAAAEESSAAGEDMAAWITEVEAEAAREDGPITTAEADAWDPFANEFGSAPASPATQPGDAKDELPWLDAIDAGGKAAPAAPAGAGEQTVLGGDAPAPAAEAAASADLAA